MLKLSFARGHSANAPLRSLSREEYFDVLDSVDIVLEAPMGCPAFVPEITFDRLLTSILTDTHLGTWRTRMMWRGHGRDSLADLLFSIFLSPSGRRGLAFGFSKSPEPMFAKPVDPQEVLCDITFPEDTAFLEGPPCHRRLKCRVWCKIGHWTFL